MYGTIALPKIMNEAKKLKILTLDIWPLVHGNQREQMEMTRKPSKQTNKTKKNNVFGRTWGEGRRGSRLVS